MPHQTEMGNKQTSTQARKASVSRDHGAKAEALNRAVEAGDGGARLRTAAQAGDTRCVKVLLEAGADVDQADSSGNTALIRAAWAGNATSIELLIGAGADVNKADFRGNRPLWITAAYGNTACVELLLDAGADVNLGETWKETPLQAAVFRCHSQCVKLLLQAGAHVNKAEYLGKTLLFVAEQNRDVDSMKLLLEAGDDVWTVEDKWRILLNAAARGDTKCVDILLKSGASVNKADARGHIPLNLAVQHGSVGCLKLLIEAGADVNQTPLGGKSPLLVAAHTHNALCFRLLLEAGADVSCILGRSVLEFIPEHPSFARFVPSSFVTSRQLNNVEATAKLLLSVGAAVKTNNLHRPTVWLVQGAHGPEIEDAKRRIRQLLFAAGVVTTSFHPTNWNDHDLKNQCRKVIRKHLLILHPNTNLFLRIPQLQTTNERAGLPEKLVSYLLYEQSLEVDWTNIA